jgi:putative hemolysin
MRRASTQTHEGLDSMVVRARTDAEPLILVIKSAIWSVDKDQPITRVATMDDLLEFIIGEIRDEHEPASDVTEDGHGGYIVSGSFDLDRVSDLFSSFRREEDIESTTVGGLVSEWLGRVPGSGEIVDRDGIRVEVLASDDLRVGQVRIGKSRTVAHE